MGYEVKVLVGKSTNFLQRKEKTNWFQIMGMVDLCKPGHDSGISKLCQSIELDKVAQKVYLYAPMGDGDTTVGEDCYGVKLKTIPLEIVLDALYADQENDTYRRFKWAIALLEAMQDDLENLEIVLYGY